MLEDLACSAVRSPVSDCERSALPIDPIGTQAPAALGAGSGKLAPVDDIVINSESKPSRDLVRAFHTPWCVRAMIYQIYVLDEAGNALSMDLVECPTEEEAKAKAAALVDEHPVELWCGHRRVTRFESAQ